MDHGSVDHRAGINICWDALFLLGRQQTVRGGMSRWSLRTQGSIRIAFLRRFGSCFLLPDPSADYPTVADRRQAAQPNDPEHA